MKALTPRQQEILALIGAHIARTGFPPTRMDICNALGFKSPNAAEEHLRALARKGAISLSSGTSRGIRLLHQQQAAQEFLADMVGIPLVGRVAAGQPILAQEHIEARYSIDPGLFAQTPDYFLKVRGMSMRDAGILEDDLLAVRRLAGGADAVRNGQIVVARLQDEVTVKRFKRQGQDIHLLPENPAFKPIIVHNGDPEFAIEGLGIGIIRNPKVLS
ncbi:MAG: transcriptional repressor LexA [Burkholderiaceae bacterium]|nr:transcriptional repressor LexA [Burkholderiaceae bacterium]